MLILLGNIFSLFYFVHSDYDSILFLDFVPLRCFCDIPEVTINNMFGITLGNLVMGIKVVMKTMDIGNSVCCSYQYQTNAISNCSLLKELQTKE